MYNIGLNYSTTRQFSDDDTRFIYMYTVALKSNALLPELKLFLDRCKS